MEININCDLGEKSKHHSNKNDPDLLQIVNSANVACGFHAGDNESMNQVVQISKKNNVSIGASLICVPDWLPAGTFTRLRPPSIVGTSVSPPSAAVIMETGISHNRWAPSL